MTLLLDGSPDVLGVQEPRLSRIPDYVSTAGLEAVELAELAGLFLDPWQQLVITHSLGERADGKWAAPTVGLVVSRQNGKGAILEARELAGLFLIGERVIIHSAHEQATASEQFRRLLDLIESVPEFDRRVLKAPKGKGNEAIELRGGQRIFFKTRTSGGGRGFSSDCLIYDEAMILPDAFVAAVSPTLAARSLTTQTGVQTWYTGSAVDQQIHEHGVAFSRIRNRGIDGDARVAFFEWSADYEDPSRVPADEIRDPQVWAQANPSLGIRIASEYVEGELGDLGPRGFSVERLSVGDWPDPNEDVERVIPVAAWNALADRESRIVGSGVLALDVAPDSSAATITGAGRRSDGLIHVGVVDRDMGTMWVASRLADLKKRLRPSAVIADANGSVSPLLPEIERAGVKVTLTNSKEYAQACGTIAKAVRDRTLRHPGTPELLAAISDSKSRPLADAWKWDRRTGADISPLVAASLAVWGVETLRPKTAGIVNLNEIADKAVKEGRAPNRCPRCLGKYDEGGERTHFCPGRRF